MRNSKLLNVSIAFSPNVGGVETHLDDLVAELLNLRWNVIALTYQPLETDKNAPTFEAKKNLYIIRLPILKGFFYKLVKSPILEFLFLFPGLFFSLPFVFIFNNIDVINAHGLVAGGASIFWGKLFGKKVVISFHSIYHFPKNGFYRNFAKFIVGSCHKVLTLSEQSRRELLQLGIAKEKIEVFTYWVNQDVFEQTDQSEAKKKYKFTKDFHVLFVGRLIEEKGLLVLLESVKTWNKQMRLIITGAGPLEKKVKDAQKKNKNIVYLGPSNQQQLAILYNAADLLIVPSTHEEGFGRVIAEALSCGLPVVAANRGGIVEAMNDEVGSLIDISASSIKTAVESYFKNPKKLISKQEKALKFARRQYSSKNISVIIGAYQ